MPYFDYNATTPLTAAAREAWLGAQTDAWQNASSPHRAGARVGLRLQAAREKIGLVMDCRADRVVFTGGATEAAHGIMQHLSEQLPADAKIAVNSTEHPCVLGAVGSYFESEQVVRLPVETSGRIEMSAVEAALGEGVKAVVVMAANNETGVLQPWEEIAELCRHAGATFVCDASQWLGKLPAGGLAAADWVFGAAHKFGGPKGVGFLLRPAGDNGFSLRRGGGQESGQRGGTEDFPGIAAMVAALLEAEQSKVLHESDRLRTREAFEREIQRRLPDTRVVGAAAERLWNTIALVMPHGENHRWVARLDKCQLQVSTGSACASGKDAPSHVLAAMRVTGEEARRVIRISAGWETTPQEWQELADALVVVAPSTKPASAVISI
ncbi:cysteine desulfurase family protein [Synoicihabitans lomoniglobus]|uniref:Aminotransferase class V-fold PLP-dependent enzyme n=1 Tax=Synoicihabitans lomoniglobus TaxID=2909285 RepID=A0AAE9ZVI2_9BACT|nr:aminotransferase class V-fold PLP-dependent enzyme [Opitutaceae bacterium LMO-M01]WED63233.1 aminotransferase class V-fold PLP-dependent enzyme [Opitutaceae bacterium LMO-M01]